MVLNLQRLKAERIASGFTQDDMAAKMGWKNRVMYSKRERGEIPIGIIDFVRIIGILGFDVNQVGYFFVPQVIKSSQNNDFCEPNSQVSM